MTGEDTEQVPQSRSHPQRDELSARHLTVGYRSGPVVHDVQIRVQPGIITTLVGPNGSGKSTLLRAMARLHPASTGRLVLTGSDATDAAPVGAGAPDLDACAMTRRQFSQRVAMLTQQRPVPDGVTVQDLVGYGRNPHHGRFRRNDPGGPAVMAHAMAITGVAELADRRVDELSGGQLQRVWLASCLAQDTGVLLLDEPTNHLDLRFQSEMLDLLVDLADAGIAVGVVLHDLNHAAAIADRVVLLHEGRVYAAGLPSEVFTDEVLSAVYDVPVVTHTDPVTGMLTTRTLRRHGLDRTRRDPAPTRARSSSRRESDPAPVPLAAQAAVIG